jgi:hypothetical protein
MMQTITHLSSSGYLFRMLTGDSGVLSPSRLSVWPKPWMKRAANWSNGGKIAIALTCHAFACRLK